MGFIAIGRLIGNQSDHYMLPFTAQPDHFAGSGMFRYIIATMTGTDEMFKIIRARHGGYNVPKHSTAREVIRLRREGKHVVIGLITDQSPNRNEAHHWTTFLNQDTVFMDGGERIARMMNYPVFYCELEKRGRGYCKAYFDLLTETPKQTAEGEITELFVRRLEQTIHRAPADRSV